MYAISVAAELTGAAVQNLRVYERRGLVDPARTEGGTRRYSEDDLDRVRRVLTLLEEGLNLAGIALVLRLEDDNARLRRLVSKADRRRAWPGPRHHGRVITRELAEALSGHGLTWNPTSGDRFLVPDRDLDDEIFVVSGMSVEVSELPFGSEVRFNGTVEWALDSIAQSEVVWLPREDQLRDALGERFVRLESVTGGYAVVLAGTSGEERHVDIDAERAYARALLSVLPGS